MLKDKSSKIKYFKKLVKGNNKLKGVKEDIIYIKVGGGIVKHVGMLEYL